MEFKEWLFNEDAGSPGAKAALYPMGYGGIGLYPPSDVITWSSDAIIYLPHDLRQLTFNWGKDMLSNPFAKDSLYEKIEGKKADQLQAGNLDPNKTNIDQQGDFSQKIKLYTIEAGGLTSDGQAFEKSHSFINKSAGKGQWDLKTIGEREGGYILPVKLNFSEFMRS
jgi:hypothetical protein